MGYITETMRRCEALIASNTKDIESLHDRVGLPAQRVRELLSDTRVNPAYGTSNVLNVYKKLKPTSQRKNINAFNPRPYSPRGHKYKHYELAIKLRALELHGEALVPRMHQSNIHQIGYRAGYRFMTRRSETLKDHILVVRIA